MRRTLTSLVLLWVCGGAVGAADWPTYRHDHRRSGFTDETWDQAADDHQWTYRSPQKPRPAWPGPARWDSWANVRGLSAMRNYDPCFHPVIAEGRVFFGSSADDSVHCLDAETGESLWTFTTDGPVRVAPAIVDGRVYFGSDDGHAYCLRAADGTLIWTSQSVSEEKQILHNGRFLSLSPCRTGVLVEGGRAYFGLGLFPWGDAVLMGVDAQTGRSDGPGCFAAKQVGLTMEGALLALDSHLVAPAGRVAPYVFDLGKGEYAGQLEGGGGSAVVLTVDGQVLCGPGNKTGWISETNVATRKQTAMHHGPVAAAVTPTHRVMVSRLRLLAVDAVSGRTLWNIPCRHHYEVIVAGETIVVGGDGAVAAFALNDGRQLWEVPVEGRAFGLAVAAGRLFVSTDEGVIHCLIPSEGSSAALNVQTAHSQSDRPSSGDRVSDTKSLPQQRAEDRRGLVGHWVVHREMAALARRRGLPDAPQRLSDVSGNAHALIQGPVRIREVGGVEALELDGETNSILVSDDLKRFAPPRDALTAEAWIRIDEANSIGGVVGCFERSKEVEQGWLLGCHQSHFVFALAADGGAEGFTHLKGTTLIRPGHWYHVAATYDGENAMLFVNGQLEAESDAQQGPIDAPPEGYYGIGVYHDSDDHHPLYGMLHEVRVYDRAATPAELARRHEEKRDQFRVPIELETGPYVQFVSPESAVVRWKTAAPMPTRLVLTDGDQQKRFDDPEPRIEHEVLLNDLPRERMLKYAIEKVTGDEVSTTLEFELDTHVNFSVVGVPENARPFADDETSPLFENAARHCLEECGFDQGICLVVGNGTGRLAWELARQSRLRVIGVDTDASRVEEARKVLRAAGVYGTRIAVHHVESYADLPIVGHFANLIVSEEWLTTGRTVSEAQELLRVLRPNGGVICLGQPAGAPHPVDAGELKSWFASSGLDADVSDGPDGIWLTAVRPSLPGAGEWSHLYGRADNSAFGGEALGGASTTSEMDVQWIGHPGPRAQADRNGRKPSPLSTNGRLFVQGLHRVIALDAFNGTVLWSLEIPAMERFNMPRDCSNWCADDEHLFIAVKDKCWQVDARNGNVIAFHPVVRAGREDWSYDWGYIAQVDGLLIGSAEKAGSAFTSYWGDADVGWYDSLTGPATFKVCSDALFTIDPATGQSLWTYEHGVIINSTITIADQRVYFVESRHPAVKQSQARRIGTPELWDQQFLVALDLKTGEIVWERPIDTADGTVVFYLASGNGTLVINASTDLKFEVTAFHAADGEKRWTQTFNWYESKGDHGKAISRPAIVDDRIFIRPKVLDLNSGEILSIEMPKAKCGTYAATTNALIFRTTEITLWNTLSGSASSWDRLRPDCWLSTIPAGGMLLSPEGGGGCSCGSWMETSVGFMPRSE